MKLENLYKYVVEAGMRHDPRPRKVVQNVLLDNKKTFRSLKGKKKAAFDMDSLFNPYNDTRILYGEKDRDVKTIIAGIDMETPELLIADRFNRMGRPIDLVMSHHPGGRALTELYKVMDLQTDRLKRLGVTAEVAEEMMGERIAEVARKFHTRNIMRNIDAAKILDIPYICVHTAADNMVTHFLQDIIDKRRPKTVKSLLNILEDIPEYREASRLGAGPRILTGDEKRSAGRVFVDMTGGTEGSKRVFGRLSQIGIETIISMHLSEEHFRQAKKEHINVIIAGHMPSDSIGLNLILDSLLKREDLDVIPCSGFIRHSRI